ncbi:MAG: hypothetical protein QNJ98_00705 [Planctomycetota bacterium]|nr:hypothetical protein [Planctomycetota bacterium]
MESGPLSAPEFVAFAKKVVAYMHVTTRIPDRKHDGLLQEKGFGGFPTLAFLDAEGNVLAEPNGRSVEAFEATLVAIGQLDELNRRIEAGETGLEAELLLVEHTLGKVRGLAFDERAAALEKVTDAQRVRIDQILVDNEVMRLAVMPRQGGLEGLKKAAEGMLALLDKGKHPTKDIRYIYPLWSTIGRYGLETKNSALLKKAADGLSTDLPEEEALKPVAAQFRESATRLDHHAAILKRVEAGEQGLEAALLLAAFRIGTVKGDAFKAQATALLDKATDEERGQLGEALREVAFGAHIRPFRSREEADAACAEMLNMIDVAGDPPVGVAKQVWGLLLGYATRQADPDLMERVADKFIEAYTGNKGAQDYARGIKTQAQKLRAEQAKAAEDAEKAEGDKPADDKPDDDKSGGG